MKLTKEGIAVIENDTHISKWIEQHGRLDFDHNMLPQILPHIKERAVILDIGAYIGDTTEALRTKGIVHAFEPNPQAYECLVYNMKDTGVICRNIALSDSVYAYEVVEPNENFGMATIQKGKGKAMTSTIDSYCSDFGVIPTFLKADCEGMELRLLKGGYETISKYKPVMVLEVNESALEAHGTSRKELLDYLTEIGYIYQDIYGQPVETLHSQFDIICYGKN